MLVVPGSIVERMVDLQIISLLMSSTSFQHILTLVFSSTPAHLVLISLDVPIKDCSVVPRRQQRGCQKKKNISGVILFCAKDAIIRGDLVPSPRFGSTQLLRQKQMYTKHKNQAAGEASLLSIVLLVCHFTVSYLFSAGFGVDALFHIATRE